MSKVQTNHETHANLPREAPPQREKFFCETKKKKNKAETNSEVKLLDLILGMVSHPQGVLTPKSKFFHRSQGVGRASKPPPVPRGDPKFLPALARG